MLVHGGTSGIGTMAIALGKLFGLTVIVTCGSDEKCAAAMALGADHAINYQTEDFVEAVKRDHRRQGRRRRARHGRRRLCAAQPRTASPRTAATSRSRSSAGRRRTINIVEVMVPPADADRLDAARAQRRVQGAGGRRDFTAPSGPLSKGQAEAGDRPDLSAGRGAAAHARMEAGEHVGKIVLTI